MLEVILGVCLGIVCGYGAGFLFQIKSPGHDLQPIFEKINLIEGKLTLVLERVEEAVDEIEPPSVAEHITGAFSMWFQNKMLRQQMELGRNLIDSADPTPATWPDASEQEPGALEELKSL
jgi:hypothetical protein